MIGLALSVGFGAQSFSTFSKRWIDQSGCERFYNGTRLFVRERTSFMGFVTGTSPQKRQILMVGHDGHRMVRESRTSSEIKALRLPAVRSLAACNKL